MKTELEAYKHKLLSKYDWRKNEAVKLRGPYKLETLRNINRNEFLKMASMMF